MTPQKIVKPEEAPDSKEEPDKVEEEEKLNPIPSAEIAQLDSDNLAPHGSRLIAGLVDGIILWAVVGILLSIVGAVTQFDGTLAIAGVVAYFLLGWLYYGLGESTSAGGFIGKRMSKIKVVDLASNTPPSFGKCSLRALLKLLFSMSIILPFVVFLTPRRQGLHDLACGTTVTSAETGD